MGVEVVAYSFERNMRSVFVLFFVAVAYIAAAEELLPDESSDMLLEVQAHISSLKKKGVSAENCKELAKSSCDEVLNERKEDQTILNLVKTGSHCVKQGQGAINKAIAHWKHVKSSHLVIKQRVIKAASVKVTFTAQTFGTLKQHKCGSIFSSQSYLTAVAHHKRALVLLKNWSKRVSEAWKVVVRMKRIASKMIHKCYCHAKSVYYKVWKQVSNRTRPSRQNKAYAKCQMMACVLNGKKVTSSKCKGRLPSLVRKKLFSKVKSVVCKKPAKPVKPVKKGGKKEGKKEGKKAGKAPPKKAASYNSSHGHPQAAAKKVVKPKPKAIAKPKKVRKVYRL